MPAPDQPDAQVQAIEFGETRRAMLVEQRPGQDARRLLTVLGLDPAIGRPVLLVCGGADDLDDKPLERAQELLGPAIMSTAALTGMSVIDGGTASGVMLLAGAARRQDPGSFPVLLGVSPLGKISYPGSPSAEGTPLDPNHSHFVLADAAQWGDETALMFGLADALSADGRVALVLAGGGSVAKDEGFEAATRGWPVFVIENTGGTADELAGAWRTYRAPRRRGWASLLPARLRGRVTPDISALSDPRVRRMLSNGDIRCFGGTQAGLLARQIAWELQDEPVLKDAWRTFATYDALAVRARRTFERFQNSILALGVIATFLALLASATRTASLHWVAVGTPILVSSTIALASRRAAGQHWVHLRAASESVKAEIYGYRTHAGIYADSKPPGEDPAARQRVLADQLDRIERALMQTEAGGGSLDRYAGPLPPDMYGAEADDDGLSPLDPGRYLRIRIGDQLSYFNRRVNQLDRRRNALQALAVIASGSGAILAAAGVEVWIGLTTAISGAALSYLAYLQVDNTIVTYNQAATQLRCLQRDWTAAGPALHDGPDFDALVTRSEGALSSELGGWVQQMTQTVNRLQEQQAQTEPKGKEEAGPRDAPAARP